MHAATATHPWHTSYLSRWRVATCGISAGTADFMTGGSEHGLIAVGLALLAAGGLTGLLAGLFGVGGGAIIVPVLYQAFTVLEVADAVRMPLTVGTSLAVIVPTSVVSYLSHRRSGAIDAAILSLWALPCALGVVLGAAVAAFAAPWVFKLVFVVIAGGIGIRLLVSAPVPRPDAALPRPAAIRAIGLGVGLLSALMGISGGMLSNILVLRLGRSMHQAVATSSGLGLCIAIPGAIGYMLAGSANAALLPPFSIGYVSVPALVTVGLLGSAFAPVGARIAHAMNRRRLQLSFGCYLLAASARFVVDLAAG